MLFLKQSTAITVNIGPFIDDTDGKTAEVALTEHPADILLAKNGGDFAGKNEGSNCTHDNLGWYHCPLDETDTNTVGRLQLHCHEAGFLPVFHEYMVLPANVYNSLILGSASDYLDVAVVEQANFDFGALQKTSLETAVDNGLDNAIPAVNTVGSVNDVLKDHLQSESDSILADTSELQTDWVNGGRLDLLLDEAITDIVAVDGKVDTIDNYIDTEIAAIKAVTDTLSLAAIADAVHDETVEGAYTQRQLLRLIASALVGKLSGAGTGTLTFRDANDTADRVTATVDANNNRTGVVLNP